MWKAQLFYLQLLIVFLFFNIQRVDGAILQSATYVLTRAHLTKQTNQNDATIFRKFMNSAISGAISCSITHSLVVPLDVVKTKMQTDANLIGKSFLQAFRSIVQLNGKKVLLNGMAATSSGYFMQGFCKFGFYDFIKSAIRRTIDDDVFVEKFHLPILLISSGLAEFIASWALTPMEVTRIYMVMNPDLKIGMLAAMQGIIHREGITGLFKGLPLIMLRQVPYTCAKLAGYEIISDRLQHIFLHNTDESQATPTTHTSGNVGIPIPAQHAVSKVAIQLLSGVSAGVVAAIVSQPADVLLSKVCGGANALSECIIIDGPTTLISTLRELGFRQCYAGLQPRALMVGSLTAMQFLIYEQTKARISQLHFPNKSFHSSKSPLVS